MEFSNLVGIHTWGWYLNRTSPVEVVVAEVKCQLLHYFLTQIGVVESNIEMGREYTSLGSELRNQIEIVFLLRVFILNDFGVNNTT